MELSHVTTSHTPAQPSTYGASYVNSVKWNLSIYIVLFDTMRAIYLMYKLVFGFFDTLLLL